MIAALLLDFAVPATQATPTAARTVVERYYSAIEHGDYRAAYQAWADNGAASGKSFARFVQGFARTAHTRVVVARPTAGEGAAGSAYITVPVTVTAQLKNGARQRFRGSYVLRRVNDVPGSTSAQRQWHMASARLRPY